MNNENNPDHRRDPANLTDHAAKLRDLNERLITIAEQLRKKTPDSLEAVIERLEEEFGPEVLKSIYDQIPNDVPEKDSSDERTACVKAHEEAGRK